MRWQELQCLTCMGVATQRSLGRKWQVFEQYAAGDPASQKQLQEQCSKNSVLGLFKTPQRNLHLMSYIMHLHQEPTEPIGQRPLVWQFTRAHKAGFERLVGRYPGFWEWQKHQE
jgi:hypothetical protein